MLGEKETYKYKEILEANAITYDRKKVKGNTSKEQEKYSKPNYRAEISSKR